MFSVEDLNYLSSVDFWNNAANVLLLGVIVRNVDKNRNVLVIEVQWLSIVQQRNKIFSYKTNAISKIPKEKNCILTLRH